MSGPTKFTTEGEIAGHEVKIVTEAEADTEQAEDEAEMIHMDLQARGQQLDEAVAEQTTHPDDVDPTVSIDWGSILGLEDDGDDEDGGEEDA